ncbi:MAG: indole-3-glycerol phosphate synthase TrpC [Chloroflexi bacterium]|nr:indole-3-glycerol phosphate synthase TrpC [Chloroflexota bacterium]
MILDQILVEKTRELEAKKRIFPFPALQRATLGQSQPLDFAAALQGNGVKLIAEVKKASPSKGVIREDFDPVEIARTYVNNGAAAISVLTESCYFQGSLVHLSDIKRVLGKNREAPLLRKDFLNDPYQIYESRACGADCLLLIVAILSPEKLGELLALSHQLKMTCLVEVHDEAELEIALKSHARIIGINNRDLRTFKVDLTTTERLRPFIPPDRIVVSESGIKCREDMEKLRQWGVNAALVGETLMSAADIASKMKELL